MKAKKLVLIALVVAVLAFGAVPAAQAINLGDILKVGGIGILVDRFAPQLNSFINTLMMQHKAAPEFATKVVPILTVGVLGNSGYIGAAQVMGPQNLVDRVKRLFRSRAALTATCSGSKD